ncbi:MAG: RsmE family RNA methyltransferase [Chitinophagales bacterium]
MNCLYIPQAPETGEFELPAVEMHHALHVLRLRIGDAFAFTNGKGRTGTAELIYADKKRSTAKMLSVLDHAPVLPVIHLGVSLLKTRDRFDFILEKCTEIGVTDIYLLRTQNAERRDMAAEKAEQVLIAAIKQSHRPFLPKLHAVMTAEDLFVESRNFKGQKFICHCRDTALPYVTTSYDPGTSVLIMIGPEGDFSKEEIAAAEENDFRSVKLSETVLRSETAAMSAVLFLHAIYQNIK